MTWTGSSSGAGPWTHSGTSRTALVADEALPITGSVSVSVRRTSDSMEVCVRGSADMRSCFAVQLSRSGSNTLALALVKYTYGTAGSSLDTGSATVTDGFAYAIEARVQQNALRIYVNGDTTAAIDYDMGQDYVDFNRFGVASATNGAVLLALERCELVEQRSDRADLLVAVAGGEVWVSEDGVTIRRVAAGAFIQNGRVALAELDQHLVGVDGTNAKDIDAADLSVTNYSPTNAGAIGATDDGGGGWIEGTTTATNIVAHLGRLAFSGMKGDEQNIIFTANDDYTDLLPDATQPGAAFALGSGQRKIGQPVRAMQSASQTTMLVATSQNWFAVRGDPAIVGFDVDQMALDVGASGPDAVWLSPGGGVMAHTQSGLMAVGEGGAFAYLSRDVLTELIQVDRAFEDYQIQLIRDPARHGLGIYITPNDSGTTTHIWYSEETERFYPERMPDAAGPTAVGLWQGKVVMGTRDGYLIVSDDAATTDYDGSPVEWSATMQVLLPPTLDGEPILTDLNVMLAEDSGEVALTCYGGRTAEEALGGTAGSASRWVLFSTTLESPSASLSYSVSAPFMAIVLSGEDETAVGFRLEAMDAMLTAGRRERTRRVARTVPRVCVPTSAPGEDDGFDEGDGNDDETGEDTVWPDLYLGAGYQGLEQGVPTQGPPFGPLGADPGGGNNWTSTHSQATNVGGILAVM